MCNYLETIYFREEQGETDFPQQLCNHLFEKYIRPTSSWWEEWEDKTLLDVGSGKGNHLVGFARIGFNVKGLDIKPECLAVLKNEAVYSEIDILKCNLEVDAFPVPSDSVDVVFSKSVIEHVQNVDHLLDEIFRVLKPKGIAILMTPDWHSQHEIFWDDYTHVKAWTRKGLQNAMRMKGFKNVECTLFRQLPILWRYPWLKPICDLVALLPHSWKWKDKKEEHFREFVRFSKEKMLLAMGRK